MKAQIWITFCELMTGFAIALLLIQLGIIGGHTTQLEQLVDGGSEVVISPPPPQGKK